ncbi:phosphate signaling complex protein PhoU [Candidatus Rhodoluna planktonica]|uniref:Phosphate-specific transport system accessory protein PhoU n=1 Tax=Candidatus Rhodoluna planktonica TaxID=535712 RepID=A0A1D9DY39_9MICO|nr:phosphate signaling complex protein PhoU [Candidatus Rhodoluna planktonica]AOY55721.1 phosphate transport system regulatory protein PhoU [Candidatus Rhodoluna planktonica]
MREVFQTELHEVQSRLVELAQDATRVIEKATNAFNQSNVHLADDAIAIADATANKALALDELVIKILARQSPVARDLRILVSALRISASLERMSALAGHIAAIARYRFPDSAVPAPLRETFVEMGKLDVELGKKVVELLQNTDVDFARQIQAQDARIDELHRHVFDVVLGSDWKENAMYTVDVTLASRYHERFADHVVDISAKVSYLTTGDWNDAE